MNIKPIAIGVGGFVYGVLVAWSVTADHLEGKMRRNQLILGEMLRRKEAEVVDLETRFLNRTPWKAISDEDLSEAISQNETLSNYVSAFEEIVSDEMEVEFDSIVEPTSADSEENATKPTRTLAASEVDQKSRLQAIIDNYTNNPEDRDEFVAKAGRVLEFAKDTPPFHIPVDIYASDPEEGDEYEKITLSYYSRDRVLVDDDQELIDDVENFVGWRNLSRFGDESGDADVVFVRNRRLATDFEVVKFDDEDAPIHIRYGMSRHEFETNKAAGIIKFRDEDSD